MSCEPRGMRFADPGTQVLVARENLKYPNSDDYMNATLAPVSLHDLAARSILSTVADGIPFIYSARVERSA